MARPFKIVLLALLAAFLALSAIHPREGLTWFMEVAPIFIVLPLLILTHKSFPITPLLAGLIFLHACVLIVGGHYTYAQVPWGDAVKDLLGLSRNPYDRLGHFMQGFVPAAAAREILLRKKAVKPGPWLFFLVVCVCLAFSAFYELIEWSAALLLKEGADSFLGAQGDVWDTQWDMFLAFSGSLCFQALFSAWHDRQMAHLESK